MIDLSSPNMKTFIFRFEPFNDEIYLGEKNLIVKCDNVVLGDEFPHRDQTVLVSFLSFQTIRQSGCDFILSVKDFEVELSSSKTKYRYSHSTCVTKWKVQLFKH